MTLPRATLLTRAGSWLSRRQLLCSLGAAAGALLAPRRARAQDMAYAQAVQRVLDELGAVTSSVARVAPSGEPGPTLAITGRLFGVDGTTPMPGAIVIAYHTDQSGLYDGPDGSAHSWRLRGAARTDANGAFEFRTIRPAPYPGGRIPAHVHFVLAVNGERFTAGELRFADDPIVDADEKAASARAGRFGWVKPVEAGTVAIDLRVEARRRL
jgi:protocatechuate 3,4-dioxygenase beta subunit